MLRSVVSLVASLGLVGCALADLRPPALADGISAEAKESGRALLDAAAAAHGGTEAFLQKQTMRYRVKDTWPNRLTQAIMPWPTDAQEVLVTAKPGEATIRLELLNGPAAGEHWGMQDWVTYRADAEGALEVRKDANIWFWLPTLQYFESIAFRIGEADVVAHIGSEEHNGRTCEKVFATWKQARPQEDIDQYVVWIDQESARISFVEYTIRDWGGFFTGTIAYDEYAEVDGLLVPTRVSVAATQDVHEVLHRFEVSDVQWDVAVEQRYLYPVPGRRYSKQSAR